VPEGDESFRCSRELDPAHTPPLPPVRKRFPGNPSCGSRLPAPGLASPIAGMSSSEASDPGTGTGRSPAAMHLVRPAAAPRGAASLLRPGRFRAWTRAHLALADAGPGASPTRARQDTGMPSAEATRPGPRPAATGYRGPAAKMPDPASLAADHAGPGRGCQSRPLRRAPSVLKTSEAVAARLCRVAPSMIESPQCDCGRTAGLVRTSGRLRPAGVIPRYHYQPVRAHCQH